MMMVSVVDCYSVLLKLRTVPLRKKHSAMLHDRVVSLQNVLIGLHCGNVRNRLLPLRILVDGVNTIVYVVVAPTVLLAGVHMALTV